ncbi:MAG: phosphotransferase [bacterium]|nr:methyltransferase domain-containing protein [Planctomycetota bacterium]HIL53210.1 methyltransferase domain-containing protein [Planctomycetota bacterium]
MSAAKRGAQPAPWPLSVGALDECLASLRAGADFKTTLEELLLGLDPALAEHLMLLLREGRGAWLPFLRSSGGHALVLGNAFSATAHVLAGAGFRPTLCDPSPERMEFEAARCLALTGVKLDIVECQGTVQLPFETNHFELVVFEGVPHGWRTDWDATLAELVRVCGGELLVVADNRLGYKHSLGARGKYGVPSPLRFCLNVLGGVRGEHTLWGYKKALQGADSASPRAFALYPHSLDFSHIVGLDGIGPKLHIGPMERRNKLKLVGQATGLFPVLTPSFAIIKTEPGLARVPLRIERILRELSEQLDEPLPVADECVATRGNTALVQTAVPGANPEEPEGRWTLHIPLSPQQERQISRHHEVIERLWSPQAELPVPEPLFHGVLAGLSLSCERRLAGFGAPELSGDKACLDRTLDDIAGHFAGLAVGATEVLDEAGFAKHFDERFDLVRRHCGHASTARAILRLRDQTREQVLGLEVPLVLFHADLRSKHIQVDGRGRVLGYLDWGSSLDASLPYTDLLLFLIHEYKQSRDLAMPVAWRSLVEKGPLRPTEKEKLQGYAAALGLDEGYCRALEGCFPIFVAAMAESNWDYSRPRWVHRTFGL